MRRSLLFVLLACALAAAAQTGAALPPAWTHWLWWRPLTAPTAEAARLAKATLPLEVYGNASTDLRDLRVIDDTGAEVAYLVHTRPGRKSQQWLGVALQETSYVPGAYTQAIVDMGTGGRAHNQIELQVEESFGEFVARVEVAASDDGREWRILRPSEPIYRFQQQGAHLQVRYGDTPARWLRLRIRDHEGQNPGKFPLTGVRVGLQVSEPPELAEIPVKLVTRPDGPQGQSWWQLDVGTGQVPASQVRFEVRTGEFDRAVEVFSSEDAKTWRRAGGNSIRRGEKPRAGQASVQLAPSEMEGDDSGACVDDAAPDVAETPASLVGPAGLTVAFPEQRGRYWRVIVRDANNPPLEGVRLTLWGVPRHVVFRQEPQRSYRLLYGNEAAKAPTYDLQRLATSEEIAAAVAATIGAEQKNTAWTDPRPWSEQHPVLLWVVLLLAVVVLGWLALRSLQPAK